MRIVYSSKLHFRAQQTDLADLDCRDILFSYYELRNLKNDSILEHTIMTGYNPVPVGEKPRRWGQLGRDKHRRLSAIKRVRMYNAEQDAEKS